jgi:hypothetical protein
MFEWDFRSFSGLHHLRVSNHLKAHILYTIYETLRKSYRIAGKIFTIKQTVVQSSHAYNWLSISDARNYTVQFEWDFRSF